jgi:hypothetical protein
LEQHYVGLRLITGPPRTHAKLEIRFLEYFLRVGSILADDVRNLYLRASEREVNGRRDTEKENHSDRNHDSDAAEYGYNSAR